MCDDVVAARQAQRAEAMCRLPGTYSLALRLRDAGLTHELIAECLAVEREGLDLLLEVAEAKLAAMLRTEQGDSSSRLLNDNAVSRASSSYEQSSNIRHD